MKVYLIGVGMGNPETMTLEARHTIEGCALLIGAPRLLELFGGKERVALISTAEIAARISLQEKGPVGVLFSGDVGFYSGAKSLRPLLAEYEVVSIPGLSSLPYFCARLGTSWQDAYVVSAHGRAGDAVGAAQCHSKTFILTGGENRAGSICRALCDRGLGGVQVALGERLSYPDEQVLRGTAEELAQVECGDLAVLLIENPTPISRAWTAPGLPDDAFLRGEVPMTKAEIRALAIAKLRLEPSHVLWDVGAGTGSVSVEGAFAVPSGRVFAVEKEPAALELLRANKARFKVSNLEIVAGRAPEALADLPAPDRVFLGGTAGNLTEILQVVWAKNPAARVVLTAITLETLGSALSCWKGFDLQDVDIAQISVTKTKSVGRYHMPDARNPVWLLTGEGRV